MCKWYMDNLSKEVGQLLSHVEEAVYSIFMMIKWLNEGLCDKIFPFLAGFRTLLERLKILHKKYHLLGMISGWIAMFLL